MVDSYEWYQYRRLCVKIVSAALYLRGRFLYANLFCSLCQNYLLIGLLPYKLYLIILRDRHRKNVWSTMDPVEAAECAGFA